MVYNIGSNRQLFIDGRYVQDAENAEIIVHKPTKTGETNFRTESLSHTRIGGYSSVMHMDGKYMMWYVENHYQTDGIYISVKYAESNDGISWERPDLGIATEYKGKPNNVVLGYGAGGVKGGTGDGTCMVFHDPLDLRGRKYKMTARHGIHEPLGLYSSADGINWQKDMDTVLDDGRFSGSDNKTFHLDSQNVIFWDDRISKYVAYVRKNHEWHGQYRMIARAESKHLSGFPNVNNMDVVMQTDRYDMQIQTEQGWVPAADFYTNATIKYPWAQDAYFMFPNIYFKYDTFLPDFENDKPRNAGPIDIRFASSRDGYVWDRHKREVFVGIGSRNEFDAYSLYMLNGIVPGNGNDMYMYYMGSDLMHGWNRGDQYEERENRILRGTGFAPERTVSAISRLVMRKDGFTSVRSDYRGGEFTTPELVFDGNWLALNVDTAAAGILRVGITDENGNYLPGYSIDECRTIHTCNNINKAVEWENGADVSRLAGKSVKLHFQMCDTDLYAFQFIK